MQQYRLLKYGDLRAISVPQTRKRYLLDDGRERDVLQEYTVRIQDQIMTARTYRVNSALQVRTIAGLDLITLLLL